MPGGVGVNLQEFSEDAVSGTRQLEFRDSLGIDQDAIVVTMASRLLYDKGVSEYAEAARMVRERRADTAFVLAGSTDLDNLASVTCADLRVWSEAGAVRIVGHIADMPTLLATSDVVVLPSYSEGIPASS